MDQAFKSALLEVIRLDDTQRFKALTYGLDGNYQLDDQYLTQICALCDSPGCMALSISMGAPVNLDDPEQMPPLNCASFSGSVETACLLIEAGARMNSIYKGESALQMAVRSSTPLHVKMLLDAGADLIPLEYAARYAHSPEVLLHFIDNGDKNAAIHEAICAGRQANVKALIDHGAKPNLMNLLTACSFNFDIIVQMILDTGVIPDDTAMQTCIYWSSIQAMEVLLKWGLKPIDYDIHYAILHNKPISLTRLLDEGCSVECPINGTFPIHVAARHGRTECLKILLARGANINASDDLGCTPVHWAAIRRKDDTLKVILEAGGLAIIDESSNDKYMPQIKPPVEDWSPIHAAVEGRGTETIEDLLQAGAKQIKMWDGRSPLHIAVQNARNDLFATLIKYGADLKLMNAHYQTPIELALSMGRQDLADELRNLAPADEEAAQKAKEIADRVSD